MIDMEAKHSNEYIKYGDDFI